MPKTRIEIIPEDALVSVQFSGSFHKKLMQLSTALGDSRTMEDFQKALKTLEPKVEPEDLYQLTVQAVVSILFEIETQARAQKKTVFVEVDDETGEITESSSQQNPPSV